ncbi:MAG TPA: peptidoglycan binding domain-containing protein, partial [Methylomirabilota bacterium]|nr:peptidoglycan binding domain-containing protein [Methylomirabilota bacterium]
MTTITMPRRLMRPMASPPERRAVLIGFFATLGAALLLLATISLSVGFATAGTVLSGVSVGGVQLAGLDRAAAEDRLRERLPSMADGQVTILVGDVQRVVAYADIGRQYEIGSMVDAAFGVGRDGNPLTDGIVRLRSFTTPTSLPVLVRGHDADALLRISSMMSNGLGQSATNAAVHPDGLTFEVTPSRDGRRVDAAAIRAALVPALASLEAGNLRVEVQPTILPPRVTTVAATRAAG